MVSLAEIGNLGLAIEATPLDPLPKMTVAESFRVAIDALLKRTGRPAYDLAEEMGVANATLTKLRLGQRGASFEMLERIRQVLGVTPAELFDPDSALAQLGLARRPTSNGLRPKGHVLEHDGNVQFASPASATDGGVDMHQDPELLSALLAYWDALALEGRLELVGHGRRLRSAGSADGRSPKARA